MKAGDVMSQSKPARSDKRYVLGVAANLEVWSNNLRRRLYPGHRSIQAEDRLHRAKLRRQRGYGNAPGVVLSYPMIFSANHGTRLNTNQAILYSPTNE